MRIKGLAEEDFVNYKYPSMFISTCFCNFKCEKESGVGCCQNSLLSRISPIYVNDDTLIERYLSNPITRAIVFGGLEPFEQYEELYDFISNLRVKHKCADDVVIYTGFNREEIDGEIMMLRSFDNIVIKFGRFIPNQPQHHDAVLGVFLASNNQYAERIS